MKRKQLQEGDDNVISYTEERPATQRKLKVAKYEGDDHNSSDSDSDASASWTSSTNAKDLPLRAMKQTVIEWIRHNYSVGAQGWTAKADIFEDYLSEWARLGKEPQLTAPAFGRLVHKAFPGIKSCRMGPRIRARHCYKGLVRRDAGSPVHSPNLMSAVSSSAASTPYTYTSPASSPVQQQHVNHQPSFGSTSAAMEQVLIDLESELETEMLGMDHQPSNVKQEPATDDDITIFAPSMATAESDLLLLKKEDNYHSSEELDAYSNIGHNYYNYQHEQQQQYSTYPQPAFVYHHNPTDCDTGSTSSSSSSPTTSSYEWTSYPAAPQFYPTAPVSLSLSSSAFYSSFPAYTSATVAPLPPYYATTAVSYTPAPYPYAGSWQPCPATATVTTAALDRCGGDVDLTAAYAVPPMSSFSSPSPSASFSLSSSARSDSIFASFFGGDV